MLLTRSQLVPLIAATEKTDVMKDNTVFTSMLRAGTMQEEVEYGQDAKFAVGVVEWSLQ